MEQGAQVAAGVQEGVSCDPGSVLACDGAGRDGTRPSMASLRPVRCRVKEYRVKTAHRVRSRRVVLDEMVSSLPLYGVAMRQEIDAKHLLRETRSREETMNQSMTIGIDLAKSIFFVVALSPSGKQLQRK